MPYTTEQPVPLVEADEWVIADIHIDPAVPSVTYQIVSKFNGSEVRRRGRSLAGAALMSRPGAPQVYATLKGMLYADAQEIGEIPAEATESVQQQQPAEPAQE